MVITVVPPTAAAKALAALQLAAREAPSTPRGRQPDGAAGVGGARPLPTQPGGGAAPVAAARRSRVATGGGRPPGAGRPPPPVAQPRTYQPARPLPPSLAAGNGKFGLARPTEGGGGGGGGELVAAMAAAVASELLELEPGPAGATAAAAAAHTALGLEAYTITVCVSPWWCTCLGAIHSSPNVLSHPYSFQRQVAEPPRWGGHNRVSAGGHETAAA